MQGNWLSTLTVFSSSIKKFEKIIPFDTSGYMCTAQKMKSSFKDCVSKCERNYIISSNIFTTSISSEIIWKFWDAAIIRGGA